MTTSEFQLQDNLLSSMSEYGDGGEDTFAYTSDLPELNSKGCFKPSKSSSSAPPSVVSMTSDGTLTFPSSMTDLFDGVLCDDELNEIPSLLNLLPEGATYEQMPLDVADSRHQQKPVKPQQDSPTVVSLESKNKNKRSSKAGTSQGANKRSKFANSKLHGGGVNGNPSVIDIAPLTRLPDSSEVHGNAPSFHNGVDTSTAHIKALTGDNGAAVCLHAIDVALKKSNRGSGSSKVSTAGSSCDSVSKDGESVSMEEKAKQSRDRNRQHARNTRVRKKAYLEELKRTLNELVEQRDQAEYRKIHKERGIAEQKDVRYRVLDEFLRLRGQNEADPARWGLILENEFSLYLPRADIPGVTCSSGHLDSEEGYAMSQSYPLGAKKKQLKGVTQVMEDSSLVASLLQSLGAERHESNYAPASLSIFYECDRNSFMMDGANVAMDWTAKSSGAIQKGANAEFSIQGTLRARFNPISNKLVSIEFSF